MEKPISLFETPPIWENVQEESDNISASIKKVNPVQTMNGSRIELYKAIQNIGEKDGDPVIALQQLVLYKHTLLAMKELYPGSDLVKGFVEPELIKIKDEAHGYMNALLKKMEVVAYDAEISKESLNAAGKMQGKAYNQMKTAHAQAKSLAPRITYVV